MNIQRQFAIILLVIALLVPTTLLLSGQSAQSAPGSNDALTDVRAANGAFYEALNAMFTGELAPMEAIWSHADEVTYLPPTRERLRGWTAVRKCWQEQANLHLGGRVQPQDVHIVLAAPTVAVVTTTEVGRNPDAPDGPIDVSIRATNVFRREAGRWKMIHHHTDLLPELAEGSSS